jgi:SAM-dependent methyltransferase
MKRRAPAAERNREPILDVLRRVLPDGAFTLEIASGSGQHVAHFAAHLPGVTFQPSDPDPSAVSSIDAYRAELDLPNILPPLRLDASEDTWPVSRADAVVCINMIHIAPFRACEGLFRGAARILPAGGVLFLYGPYRFSGAFTAPSNEAFDASLKQMDPSYGVRDLDDLTRLAAQSGFVHEETIPMPANNHSLVFRKTS